MHIYSLHTRNYYNGLNFCWQVYQKLGEGMYITEDAYAGSSLLLHGLHYTLSYTLDPNTHHWSLVATLPAHGE